MSQMSSSCPQSASLPVSVPLWVRGLPWIFGAGGPALSVLLLLFAPASEGSVEAIRVYASASPAVQAWYDERVNEGGDFSPADEVVAHLTYLLDTP